jgi:hypothetical protein
MQYIDLATVEALELRAPKVSTEDARKISEGMKCGALFSAIRDQELRKVITRNIMQVDYLIPSLRTFCEDTKYLEPCATAVKLLVQPKHKETVDKALRRIYSPPENNPNRALLQESERDFNEVECSDSMRFDFSRLQIFLACMRNFDSMVNIACRKDTKEAKPAVTAPNAIIIHNLAVLAQQLGFNSDRIEHLISTQPLLDEIYSCLLRLDTNRYIQEEELRERARNHLRLWKEEGYQMDTNMDRSEDRVQLTVDTEDQKLIQRCGRPFQRSHINDKEFLFLRQIYDTRVTVGRFITSFYVKRSIFISFFGEARTISFQRPFTTENAFSPGNGEGGAGAIISEYIDPTRHEPDVEGMQGLENTQLTRSFPHTSSSQTTTDMVPFRSSDDRYEPDVEGMQGSENTQLTTSAHHTFSSHTTTDMVTFRHSNGTEKLVPFDKQTVDTHLKKLRHTTTMMIRNESGLSVVPANKCYYQLEKSGQRVIECTPTAIPTPPNVRQLVQRLEPHQAFEDEEQL